MTNYIVAMAAAVALLAGACHAADTPPASRPAAARPAAATPAPAAAPAASVAVQRWVQAPGSSLTFTFDQAGAASKGSFKQFSTELAYDDKSPAAGSLNVKVQIASIDTQDQERNDMLVSADLFDAAEIPDRAVHLERLFAHGRRWPRSRGQAHAARRDARSSAAFENRTDRRRPRTLGRHAPSSVSTTASARATGNPPKAWVTK